MRSLFLLLALSLPASAADYYVATNGDDANPGSAALPFLTPQHAATTAVAGDTVIFKDGQYVFLEKLRLRNKGTAALPITFTSENLHGANLHMPPATGTSDPVISVCWFSAGVCQPVQEMYIIIENLDISGGRRHGIQAEGGGQLIIRNNIIRDSGNDTVKINGEADVVLIEGNEIYGTGVSDDCTPGCNSDGIDITSSDYVTVKNNHIHDVISWGVYNKKGSQFVVIEDNLIHDIGESGIGIGESTVAYDTIVRNNILYNIQETCLQGSGAKESVFHNNTCYNVSLVGGANWSPIRMAPAQQVTGDEHPPGDDKYSRNVTVRNNIYVMNNADGYCFHTSDPSFGQGGDKAAHLALMQMYNNVCFNLQGGPYYWQFEGNTQTGLAAWQAWTDAFTGDTDQSATDVVGDPLFLSIDPAHADFLKPGPGSPALALNAGANGAAPNNAATGTVTVTGTALEDNTLKVVWSLADTDGMGQANIEWRRGGVPVSGYTSTSYRLGDAEVSFKMSARVYFTDLLGNPESVVSADTAPVVNINDAPTGVHTIELVP